MSSYETRGIRPLGEDSSPCHRIASGLYIVREIRTILICEPKSRGLLALRVMLQPCCNARMSNLRSLTDKRASHLGSHWGRAVAKRLRGHSARILSLLNEGVVLRNSRYSPFGRRFLALPPTRKRSLLCGGNANSTPNQVWGRVLKSLLRSNQQKSHPRGMAFLLAEKVERKTTLHILIFR